MNIGLAVKEARKSIGLTQSDLAVLAGVSRQAVVHLEANGGRVSTLLAVSEHIQFRVANVADGDRITEQVRKARLRKKLTQREAARIADVSVPTLRAVEAGGGSVKSLSKIIAILAPAARNMKRYRAHWQLKRDVRFTPPHIVDQVIEAFGSIDIDPCGDHRSFVKAPRIITEAEDGLISAWSGKLAFVNPPFSDLTRWINRCADAYERGEVETVVGLFPARTETTTFRDRAFGKADVLLLRGRICFHDENRTKMAAAPFALMFCVWGAERELVAKFSEIAGCSVIWARPN